MNSLKIRFFIILVLITGLALTGFGYFIYNRIHDFLEDNTKQKLLVLAETVIKKINPEQSPILNDIDSHFSMHFKPGPIREADSLALIWNDERELLFQSGFTNGNPIKFKPHKHKPVHFQRFQIDNKMYSGLWISYLPVQRYDTMVNQIELVSADTPGSITLLMAFVDDDFDRYLNTLIFWLWSGGLAFSLLIGLTGRYMIQWGLKPVAQLNRQLETMDANTLSERVQLTSPPDEIQPAVQTLNLLLEKLEKSFEWEKQFSSDVAHELRTPLSALQCSSEIALTQECNNEAHERFMSQVHRASIDLHDIVEHLLLLARLESLDSRREFQPIDLAATITECIGKMEESIQEHSIHIDWTPPSQVIPVFGHEGWLEIMIRNLLSNAVRFNKHGGKIFISLTHDDEYVNLSVRDTGIGIPPESLDKVFERFYRVEEARDRKTGGAGLGLSIVWSIAKLHNGSVEVDSHMGEGTTFAVFLPCG